MELRRGLTVQCRKCYLWHPLEYQIQKNGEKHLVYRHPNKSGRKTAIYIRYEENLPIPTYESKERVLARGQLSLIE